MQSISVVYGSNLAKRSINNKQSISVVYGSNLAERSINNKQFIYVVYSLGSNLVYRFKYGLEIYQKHAVYLQSKNYKQVISVVYGWNLAERSKNNMQSIYVVYGSNLA